MKIIKRLFRVIYFLFVIGVLFSCFGFVFGQSENILTPLETFDIPLSNGSISFAVGGVYDSANLKDNMWSFSNLQLNNNENEKVSFKVSVRNCSITISSIQVYNRSFGNEISKRLRVRFTIVGNGVQVFDFGLDPKMGEWDVRVNDDYIAKGRGWNLSDEGIITLTNATDNVILSHNGFTYASMNQSFFDQHYAVIATTTAVFVIVLVSMSIKLIRKRK